MPDDPRLERLKPLQSEDALGALSDPEAHAGELTAGQRWRRLRAWFSAELDAWTGRLERGGKWAKALAVIVVSMATVAGVIWRAVIFYTRPAPAEEPATGVASTTMDRVEKPKPPAP